jgi:hypothetical protein
LWPDWNFTVAGLICRLPNLTGQSAFNSWTVLDPSTPPIPEAIPSTEPLSQTKPRPGGAFFFWPPQLAASFC